MDDELADRIPGDDPELDARLVSHDRVAEVRAAVGQLPEPYREVITLRYFGELSLKDVCALTGRPEGTVKAQVHRGLARLRDLMAEGER
jgi:RNA polymerase sigma-70 factor (ECF subfamily)